LKVIRSNLVLIFSKRFVFIELNPFCFRSFTASGFMSAVVMFFLSMNSDAVSARIPEPVPMSSIVIDDAGWGRMGEYGGEFRRLSPSIEG